MSDSPNQPIVHRLRLEWPPSTNAIWRAHRGRVLLSETGRQFYRRNSWLIAQQMNAARLHGELARHAPAVPVGVRIALHPPNRRKIDLDNRIKAILDVMTKGGVWADDSIVNEIQIAREGPDPMKAGFATVETWNNDRRTETGRGADGSE